MRQNMPCTGFWRPSEIIWCTYTNRQFQYMCRTASVNRVATIIHAQAVRSPAGQRPWGAGGRYGGRAPIKRRQRRSRYGGGTPVRQSQGEALRSAATGSPPRGRGRGWGDVIGFLRIRSIRRKARMHLHSSLSKSGGCLLSHLV